MIAFFRRIRKNLLSEGKKRKYFKYAIGEIILVVIGILIALQINNWNENQKNKQLETVYLKELLEDFETNLKKSNEITGRIHRMFPKLITLLEQSALEKPTLPLDSLNKAFALINHMPTYTSTDRVYNNLIGSGDFKLISNRELKTHIADYHQALDLLKLIQSTHEMELVNTFQHYIIDNLDFQGVRDIIDFGYDIPPAVEEDKIYEVLGDREFRNIIIVKLTILADLWDMNKVIGEINENLVAVTKEQLKT